MSARFIVGDTRDVTATLPDASVDLIMTSPPFLALRSYLPADHPDKHREIGSEANPAEFIDMLLGLTAEWDRVLAPHGSICVELGDTYSGAGGYGSPDSPNPAYGASSFEERFEGRTAKRFKRKDDGWPLAKSKALIPELYRIALAYGINPLTGQPSPAGRWRVRNVVTWCRPNPPVGALGDKYRPATSDLVIACRSDRRWFDLDAVRTPLSDRRADTSDPRSEPNKQRDGTNFNTLGPYDPSQSGGAPPLDYWVIPPKGYEGAHYAVYPEELCRVPILSMCPQWVCRTCGEPRRRVVGAVTLDAYRASTRAQTRRAVELADKAGLTDEHIQAVMARGISEGGKAAIVSTGNGKNTDAVNTLAAEAKAVLGGYVREFTQTTTAQRDSTFTDCGHDDWRNGVVYDPFAGSGTTLAVAVGTGRDAIGAELDERNAHLALERCGMFLTVEHLEASR